MNAVNLIGRITRDPELKTSANGRSFVAFTLAVSEYSGGNQYTQFVPCFAWEKSAENMVRFVKKGAQLGVVGSLNVRQTNNNGEVRTVVTVNAQRVEFLGTANTSGANNNQNQVPSFTASNNDNFANYDLSDQPQKNEDIDVDSDAILFED